MTFLFNVNQLLMNYFKCLTQNTVRTQNVYFMQIFFDILLDHSLHHEDL